jgi:hypothetical protein
LHISEGTVLTFVVQDLKNQTRDLADLYTGAAKLPLSGSNFAIGVWAGSRYVMAKLVSTNGGVRKYQLAIPKTAVVHLFLDTRLTVLGATGGPIATHVPGDALAANGAAEIVTSLIVP